MNSEELIKKAIDDFHMLKKGQKVLVGFSGGSDSVCLLNALYDMGYSVFAAHINHNMRDTAKRDMEFCRDFCEKKGIVFFLKTADKGVLKNEADAREFRYSFFKEVMQKEKIETLATAHNKNDSAETVLLHMIRGASTDGLCGIKPIDNNLVRPLIYLKKENVLEYIKQKNLSYVTDETNFQNIYQRNKLRLDFIPKIEKEFNPSFIDVVADNALLLQRDCEYLLKMTKNTYDLLNENGRFLVKNLINCENAIINRVIEQVWKNATGKDENLSFSYIEKIIKILKNDTGNKSICLPNGMCAKKEYGYFYIAKREEDFSFCFPIKTQTVYDIPKTNKKIELTKNKIGQSIFIKGDENLILRSWQKGDKFYPEGMKGSKKLSDFFTDKKIPRHERNLVPILEVNGEIAAVCGYRMDRRFTNKQNGNTYYINIFSI